MPSGGSGLRSWEVNLTLRPPNVTVASSPQSRSRAHVEVHQQFPDGVPRKVIIIGAPEAVDLAAYLVDEVRRDWHWLDPGVVSK